MPGGNENGGAFNNNTANGSALEDNNNLSLEGEEAKCNNNNNNNNQQQLSKTIMLDGDFEFVRYLGVDELRERMANLDHEMEAEIEELQRRYAAKRQPILDAMDLKKKRQQNF